MSRKSRKKYIKFPLNYKQKQKLFSLSKKYEVDPETLLQDIEDFLETVSNNFELSNWNRIIDGLNIELMKAKIKERSDDIVETKKKINLQKKLLKEYEKDYLTIIQLGESLDAIFKGEKGK